MKPTTLRVLLIAVLLTVQVATIVSVMVSYDQIVTDQVTSRSYDRVKAQAARYADQVRTFLEPAEVSLISAQSLVADSTTMTAASTALEQYFLTQLQQNPTIRGLSLAHPDGAYMLATRRHDILVIHRKSAQDKVVQVTEVHPQRREKWRAFQIPDMRYDPRTRPWYVGAQAKHSTVWTRPYNFFGSQVPGLSMSVPVSASNVASGKGVLAVHVGVAELSTLIAAVSDTQNGDAALVDRHYNTIAYSGAGSAEINHKLANDVSLHNVAGPEMRALQARLMVPDDVSSVQADQFLRFSFDGHEHLGFVKSFMLSEVETDWRLLVQAPAGIYTGDLYGYFIQRLWILIGVITCSSLIAVLAIVRLTAPVYDMHKRATRDRLTGALSRGELQRRLTSTPHGRRSGEPATRQVLVALDLDGFKQVNDRHGHGAGDEVLIELVRRLRKRLRHDDLIGRIGGDEFVLAMQIDTDLDVIAVIEQIRDRVVSTPMSSEAGPLAVGMTAGVAIRQNGETSADAMARADQALIAGKAVDKNRCYLAKEPTVLVSALPVEGSAPATCAVRGEDTVPVLVNTRSVRSAVEVDA